MNEVRLFFEIPVIQYSTEAHKYLDGIKSIGIRTTHCSVKQGNRNTLKVTRISLFQFTNRNARVILSSREKGLKQNGGLSTGVLRMKNPIRHPHGLLPVVTYAGSDHVVLHTFR